MNTDENTDELAEWERELMRAVMEDEPLPPHPPVTKRDKLIAELNACAKHPDREYGQSNAEDALMEYLETSLSFGRQIVDAYREASSYFNQFNPRP